MRLQLVAVSVTVALTGYGSTPVFLVFGCLMFHWGPPFLGDAGLQEWNSGGLGYTTQFGPRRSCRPCPALLPMIGSLLHLRSSVRIIFEAT